MVISVMLGGALGALLRVVIASAVMQRFSSGFPYGTLTVNVLGSLLIGFVFVFLQHKFVDNVILRYGVIAGLLGGFTTFSAFSLETLNLLSNGQLMAGMSNVIVSVVICVMATLVGVAMARLFV